MRAFMSGVMIVLMGCGPDNRFWANTEDLQGVDMAGHIDMFSAETRAGWGTAKAWQDSTLRREGFSVDVRGEGDGVIMTRVKIKGMDFSELQPGTRVDFNTDASSDLKVSLLGCGGYSEDIDPTAAVHMVSVPIALRI
ncbi:MAG: hypothetical protein AAFV53_39735, partial [Myxococcota bacterium]